MRDFYFFFFQAEDGIRDHCVTGVQTCALPISARAHAAHVEREHRLHEVEAGLHVVALYYGDGGGHVEAGERLPAARAPEARLERVAVEAGAVGRVPDREPAVGDLGRLRHALRPGGGAGDGDLAPVEDRAERLPEAARARAAIGDLIMLALVLERALAGPDRAHDLDVLARPRERLAEGLPVPALDHLRAGDAEPEEEPAARELVERGRGRRGQGRRARRHLHNRAAEADIARLPADPGERRHRVRAVRFRRPHRVEAEALGLAHEVHVDRELRARVADVQAEADHAATQLPWKP